MGTAGALLACASALAGCTTVHVQNADVVETSRYGLAVLQLKPAAGDALVVVTKGVGITLGSQSFSLGYLDETTVLAADVSRCRAFILVRDAAQLAGLQEFLRQQPQVSQLCVLKEGSSP